MLLLGSIGWGLIAVGAVTHLWHHRRLRRLLSAHVDADRAAAAALLAVELVIAIALPAAVLADAGWLPLAAAAAGALGIGFVIWILRLLLSGSDLPCACSFSDAPTSWWSFARAAAVASAFLLIFADVGALMVAERLVSLSAGAAIATAIYVLPEALTWPEAARAQLARIDSHAPVSSS